MTLVDSMRIALDAVGLRLSWYVIRRKKEPQSLVDAYNNLSTVIGILDGGAELRITNTTTCEEGE